MDGVQQLYVDVKLTLDSFHGIQDQKKAFMIELRHSLMEFLVIKARSLQQKLQDYFICRNDSLEISVNKVQGSLKEAYEAHTMIFTLRGQFIEVFNDVAKPPLTTSEGDLLCNDYGEAHFKKISNVTEKGVGQLNHIQEYYVCLVSEILESLPILIESKLQELEITALERNMQSRKWAELKNEQIQDDLNKACQVLESMEKIKHQMESLFQVLYKQKG